MGHEVAEGLGPTLDVGGVAKGEACLQECLKGDQALFFETRALCDGPARPGDFA